MSLLALALSAPGLLALLLVAVACLVYFRRTRNRLSLVLTITALGRLAISLASVTLAVVRGAPHDVAGLLRYSADPGALSAALSLLGQLFAFLFSVALAVFLLATSSSMSAGTADTAD